MIEVEANLILALASLIVLAILVAVAWAMGAAVSSGRRPVRQGPARPAIRPAPSRNVIQGDYEVKVIER